MIRRGCLKNLTGKKNLYYNIKPWKKRDEKKKRFFIQIFSLVSDKSLYVLIMPTRPAKSQNVQAFTHPSVKIFAKVLVLTCNFFYPKRGRKVFSKCFDFFKVRFLSHPFLITNNKSDFFLVSLF